MLFIDEKSGVDKEALRMYVLAKLSKLKTASEAVIHGQSEEQFWQGVHNMIGMADDEPKKEELQRVENELRMLPEFIQKWIDTSVETDSRFELFVQAKASEIASGDYDHDYFWALQIRHDQLIGLVNVVEKLVEHIERWLKVGSQAMLEDPVFLGLTEYSLADQVYLEAEEIHRNRGKHLER